MRRISIKLILSFVFLLEFASLPAQPRWEHFSTCNALKTLLVRGNELWVGSYSTIIKKDLTSGALTEYNPFNSPLSKSLNLSINAIAEDPFGNLWFGTSEGLLEFDGYNWSTFTSANFGLPSDRIGSIVFDTSGVMWVGCLGPVNGGLARFDGAAWTYYDTTNSPVKKNATSYSLAIDKQNNLWVALSPGGSAYEGGLVHFDGTNWHRDLTGISQYAYNIAIDTNDTKWFFSSNFSGLTSDSDSVFNYYNHFNSSLPAADIFSITVNKRNNDLWVAYGGTNDVGLAKYSGGIWTVYSSNQYPLLGNGTFPVGVSIGCDSNGTLWAGQGVGLVKLDLSGVSIQYLNGPLGGQVNSIAIDNKHQLWSSSVGGERYNAGLSSYDGIRWKHYTPFNSAIPYMDIGKVTFDNLDNLWTIDGGSLEVLLKYDGQIWSWIPLNNQYFRACDILADHQNKIWFCGIGLSNVIGNYNGATISWFDSLSLPALALHLPRYLMTDTSGKLICITTEGTDVRDLITFDGTNWTTTDISQATGLSGLHDVELDHQNHIWFCFEDGLAEFDGVVWITYTTSNSGLPANSTSAIAFDSQNNKWIGSTRWAGDNILSKYDGTTWTSYDTTNSELRAWNRITDLCVDNNNNIYIASEIELSIFNEIKIQPIGEAFDQVEVSGMCFWDQNQDGHFNAGENGLPMQEILILPDSLFTYSSSTGAFSTVLNPGNYTLNFQGHSNWQLTTDSANYHILIDSVSISGYDFGCSSGDNFIGLDANIQLAAPRCQTVVPLWINYQNTGSEDVSGRVVLDLDQKISFVSSADTPIIIQPHHVEWQFSGLHPFEMRQMTSLVMINAVAEDSVFALITVVDSIHSDTCRKYYRDVARCSFDPNEKGVYPQGIADQHFTLISDTLQYVIHFQNLGNDTAFSVAVYDTLDDNLDLTKFKLIASSHEAFVDLFMDGILVVRFPGIALPYKQIDEPGSMGFVKFSFVAQQTIPNNTRVENMAYIRFDNNPLVPTNVVFNTLVDWLTLDVSPQPEKKYIVVLYPNPSIDDFYIKNETYSDKTPAELTIFDLAGRVAFCKTLHENPERIETSLMPGIYFFRVSKANHVLGTGKLIRE